MGVTDELASDEARADDEVPTDGDAPADDQARPGSGAREPEDSGRPDEPAAEEQGDDPRLVRLTLGLTILPFVVSAIALVVNGRGHHMPTGDHAMIEALTRDAFGDPANIPLIGLYSRADWSHPGPLQFFVLAPIYWLTGGASIGTNLGALVINAASVMGIALIARRRGGLPLMLCTVIASALLIRTLGAGWVHDPWNTYLPVLPYALLVFLAWSMACGETWALPVGVVVASFVAQTHIGFIALGAPLLLWGAGMLVMRRARGGRHWADPEARQQWAERVRPLLKPAALSAAIGAVLWVPPVIDLLVNRPSNFTRVWRWFGEGEDEPQTLSAGVRVMFGQFKLEPEWLTVKQENAFPIGQSPYILGGYPIPILLLVVVGAAVYLWLSRGGAGDGADDSRARVLRDDRRHLLGLMGVLFVCGVVAVWRTVGPAFDYRLRWTWILPMFALAMVGWAGWLALTRWRPQTHRWLTFGAVGVLAVAVSVNTVTAARAGRPYEGETEVIASLLPQVEEALPEGAGEGDGVVLLIEPYHTASVYSRGLAWRMERQGLNVRVEPTLELLLGKHRVYDGEPIDAVFMVMANEGIEAVGGMVEQGMIEPVAEWKDESADQWEEERARRDGLNLAYQAGEISRAEYDRETAALVSPESTADYAHRVTVYLDTRRPVEPNLGIGHWPAP